MDLGLDIRTVGRAAKAVAAQEVRELVPADLELLSFEKGSEAPALKRIGSRHHALARALASGVSAGEAALIVGMDISRVSILKSDPSFKELLAFYLADVNAAYRSMHDSLAGIAYDATQELQRRLEEEPEELSVNALLEITKLGADRTGHGPKSTQDLNVNVGLAARLQEAREAVRQRRLIDITPEK